MSFALEYLGIAACHEKLQLESFSNFFEGPFLELSKTVFREETDAILAEMERVEVNRDGWVLVTKDEAVEPEDIGQTGVFEKRPVVGQHS